MQKTPPALQPFKNEQDAFTIGDLNIENRLDRIQLYGTLHITRDQAGLALARQLQTVIGSTIAALESEHLPDHITIAPIDQIDNPFN
jgi:hypothetical protein